VPRAKAMIALEAVKERKTVNELAAEYGIHPTPNQPVETAVARGAA